jgi:hypothetical protein
MRASQRDVEKRRKIRERLELGHGHIRIMDELHCGKLMMAEVAAALKATGWQKPKAEKPKRSALEPQGPKQRATPQSATHSAWLVRPSGRIQALRRLEGLDPITGAPA